MEYREIIRIVLRRWWLIVLPVVLSAVVSIPDLLRDNADFGGGFTTQIRYSAAQKLNISERETDYTDIWLASEYTVDALTDWVRSASFRGEIGSVLGETPVSLEGLQIAADNVRSVGVVYLSHLNRKSLSAIADAAALALGNRSQKYFPQLGGEAAQVTILEQRELAPSPPGLMTRLAPLIRMGIALLVGLAIAFVAEYIDPTIYHQDDLRRLGLPLLGSIPKQRA